jgi:hypothetical protein
MPRKTAKPVKNASATVATAATTASTTTKDASSKAMTTTTTTTATMTVNNNNIGLKAAKVAKKKVGWFASILSRTFLYQMCRGSINKGSKKERCERGQNAIFGGRGVGWWYGADALGLLQRGGVFYSFFLFFFVIMWGLFDFCNVRVLQSCTPAYQMAVKGY